MLIIKLVFIIIILVGIIAFMVKTYAGLLIFYFTFAIFVPFLYAKFYEKNIKRPFLEGGVISVLIPILTLERLYLSSIGFFNKNFIMPDYISPDIISVEWPEMMFTYKLILICLFSVGGATCSITKDFFKRELLLQNLVNILFVILFIIFFIYGISQWLINSQFVWH